MTALNGEYTSREIMTMFGVDYRTMYRLLRLFPDAFPEPTGLRPIPGSQMMGRFYRREGVEALYKRYELSRKPGEKPIATFRRMLGRPQKPRGRSQEAVVRAAAVAKSEERLTSLESKVDQILEIMKRLA